MAQITGPIIAITLVLLSVFVPIGFISGISGELFRQFAVTVGVAMFLSAINALTLSPALCALLLKPHHGPRRGPIGYGHALHRPRARRLWRDRRAPRAIALISLPIVAARGVRRLCAGQGDADGLSARGRSGRVLHHRAAAGRRLGRAHLGVVSQVEKILQTEPSVENISSIAGINFVDNYSQPNAAFLIVSLKPFEDRNGPGQTAKAIIGRLSGSLRAVRGGTACRSRRRR